MKRSSPKSPSCPAAPPTAAPTKKALDNVQVVIQEWIETAKNSAGISRDPKGSLTYG